MIVVEPLIWNHSFCVGFDAPPFLDIDSRIFLKFLRLKIGVFQFIEIDTSLRSIGQKSGGEKRLRMHTPHSSPYLWSGECLCLDLSSKIVAL